MSNLVTIASKTVTIAQLNQLHAHLIQNSLHRHGFWLELLLDHCTRLRAPPLYARLLFHSSSSPNIYIFTSILRYYSQTGDHGEVLCLFRQMNNSCNVKPDAYVYPIVIKSAGKAGIIFHAHVRKLGHFQDPYVRNVIMDAYGKYGCTEIARKVFDEMSSRKVADWNSMISGYWKWGNEEEACRLFNSQ
ncbi:pentatricopeptide repeat-containing protein At1g14470-like [Carica papaya]|uniref:pentatricopeptide repeat-containing protein At1g14470-like n=1 Tax=Carica papaya TaxID=3649 RepID=UPI000B8CED9A|nr:pentatricopeptide repeat-containing protein At1g14470-like [Carica papaya]